MKKILLAGLLLYSGFLCYAQEDSTAAINKTWMNYASDSNLTLQQITDICDSQFIAAGYGMPPSDGDSSKDQDGTAFVDYLRWKGFWETRYDVFTGKLHNFSKDAASRLTSGPPPTNCEGTSTLQSSFSSIPSVTKGWEFIGPQNMDQHIGRIDGGVVNPTNQAEVYATDAFGGLWKTTNATSAPNNTWVCLSDHLPSMAGIGISNLYVDFSSTPHKLFCLVGTPSSIAVGNSFNTVGVFYSLDDGATFSQLNLSSIIPNLTTDPIYIMKYWPGNSGSSSKYIFICSRFKIYRVDITNPASISTSIVVDMTSIIPNDNMGGRFQGFSDISFSASSPSVMYIATNSNNGLAFNCSAALYKLTNCNTCTTCTLSQITSNLTTAPSPPDYLGGSGQFNSGTDLPDGWVAATEWSINGSSHDAECTPTVPSPPAPTKVSSIEVGVDGSYIENFTYKVSFTLNLPPFTAVDVLMKDVNSSNIYGLDWGTSISGPTASTSYLTNFPVNYGAYTNGHYENTTSSMLPITVTDATVPTTHFVDRLEFGAYALSGYPSPTYSGSQFITLDNVIVKEPFQNYIFNIASNSATSGYLYCLTSIDPNGDTKFFQKIQDLGTSYNVTTYSMPSSELSTFQFSSVFPNIIYGVSTHTPDIWKYDLSKSTYTTAGTGVHTDSRWMQPMPNSGGTDDIIYLGEDGGVAKGSFGTPFQSLNGSGMKTGWTFDIGSSIHSGDVGIALTDNDIMRSNPKDFTTWQFYDVGDGGQVKYGKRYATRTVQFEGSSYSSGFLHLSGDGLPGTPYSTVNFNGDVNVPNLSKLAVTYNNEYFGTGILDKHGNCTDCNIYNIQVASGTGGISSPYILNKNNLTISSSFVPTSINVQRVQSVAPDMYDPTFVAGYMQTVPWNPSYFAVSTNANTLVPTWNLKTNTTGTSFICMVADPRYPASSKRMWAGASGYAGTAGANRVFQTTNSGGSWTDMSYGLPTGPVNALAYDEQSHYLFAGTDQGVYAFNVDNGSNSSTNPWVCYSLNLPNSFVTGLDINRCTGKIYVSMYGRGAYQAELPPDPNATGGTTTGGANGINDICDIDKISSSTTWNQDKDETRSIYIPAGVTLTIQNCTVNMGRDKSIIVAPKGKLIIDNATITNSCGYMWKGIEARGDMTKPQYASNQSTVIIKNNSTIQYAQTGIANYNISGSDYNSTGGIIQVSNSTFNDNHIAASFAPYRGTYLSIPQKDFSYFALTNFTIDNNYRDYNGAYPFQEHVAILQDDGVTFTGCTFSNTKNSGNGVYAMDAGVYILPYYSPGDIFRLHPRHGQFSGFQRGVDIESSKGLSPLTSVDFTDFSACGIGVFVSAINDVSITRSSFNVGLGPQISQVSGDPCPQNIGIYMKNASPFQVEQNSFTGNPSSSINNYGAVVENAKYYHDNKVYRSTFSSLNYGCVAVGDNGAGTNPGLHILCNSFNNNTTDIGLEPLASIPTQGSIDTSTGNTFTSGGGTIVDNGSSFWYYNNGANSLPATISPAHSVFFKTANAANTCASTFGGDPSFTTKLTSSGLNGIKAGFKNVKPAWQNYAGQYNSLMDGGCTICRVNQIQGNAQGIYNTLMAETPYLSSTVLSAAGSANHFSYSQYYNLLYACPEALRDNDLMNFIQYSIPNPISQQDIAALRQRANTNTARTTLESKIYDTHTVMSQDALRIIQALKVNTDTTWLALDTNSTHAQYDSTSTYSGIDSVGVWLQNIGDLSSQYQLVGYYLAMGNMSAASSALSNVPNMFQLSADETTEYNHYNTLVNILVNMKNSGRNLAQLTSTELNNIYALGANSATDDAQVIAADIINFGGGIGFPLPPNRFYPIPCLPLMWTSGKPEGAEANSSMQEYNGVEAYPNPARDNVTFKYDIAKINGKAHLTITDIVGRLKADIPVDNVHGYIDWSTEKLSPGVYIYKLSDASKTIGTGKLTIVK